MHRCCAHHERSAGCTPNLYVYTLPEVYRDVDDTSPGRGIGSELLSRDLTNLESAPHHHSMRVDRTAAAAPSAPS